MYTNFEACQDIKNFKDISRRFLFIYLPLGKVCSTCIIFFNNILKMYEIIKCAAVPSNQSFTLIKHSNSYLIRQHILLKN